MRTSRPDVFAAGDVALADNVSAGRPVPVEHWGDALAMGEIAGRVAAGELAQWTQPPGFWSTIGDRTLKYAAWGDGFDSVDVQDDPDGSFTIWYGSGGRVVGVLTHEADADYERGQELVRTGAQWRRR
jgi:NADPH-dependent 2,4-dienoyl-CoA reductase/sulfur reductase-like enzyme